MATARKPFYTPEQYLEQERQAEFRSEYIAGEIFAMAGASRRHNLITLNVASLLGAQIGDSCEAYANDMRIQVKPTGMYTYPDIVIVCGERKFLDAGEDTLLNPTIIVEVLSPSTASYDRVEKFAYYRRLASLREYVLVSQDRPCVERYERTSDSDAEWLYTVAEGPEATLLLPSIGSTLALADIYRKITFAEADDHPVPD